MSCRFHPSKPQMTKRRPREKGRRVHATRGGRKGLRPRKSAAWAGLPQGSTRRRHGKDNAPAYMTRDAYSSDRGAVAGTLGSVSLVRCRRLGPPRRRAYTVLRICRYRRRRAVLAAGRRWSDGTRFLQQPPRLRRPNRRRQINDRGHSAICRVSCASAGHAMCSLAGNILVRP